MNILRALAVRSVEEAIRDIPVIDFDPAFEPGHPSDIDGVAQQVGRASETVGFFYLAGHGVPDAVVDAAFAASREFHALPLAEKMRLKLNQNNIGYLPVNQSIQKASTVHRATRPNYNESFFISHDRPADHPDVVAGMPLRGRNQWPDFTPFFANEAHVNLRFLHYPPQGVRTTGSSVRGRTPTTRSSRSWPGPRCRGSRCGCRPGRGSPRP